MSRLGKRLSILAGLLVWATTTLAYQGKVNDEVTGAAIEGAIVTLGEEAARTDREGRFSVEGNGETLKFRAAGYSRREIAIDAQAGDEINAALTPFNVKGLYLTVYGIANRKLREAALATIENNHMNALVVDIKGDRGFIPFQIDLALAKQIGAQDTILIRDMKALLKELKDKNLYLIARIVVFKDDLLAKSRQDLAVKTRGGGIYKDRENLRWVDPFRPEVWDYNIAIAKIAAELGFDEVQFDYVRFPDTKGDAYSKPATVSSRTEAITGFLQSARRMLAPYNVFVAADVFGYVLWNQDDTGIGQQIVPIAQSIDIISPMLYPSGYHLGIPKYRNPVNHPYQIVYQSLKRAQERTGASPLQFRPWLQAFRDYAFHGGDFKEERMRIQVKAAEDFGSSGWMFWNPRNVYPSGSFSDASTKN